MGSLNTLFKLRNPLRSQFRSFVAGGNAVN